MGAVEERGALGRGQGGAARRPAGAILVERPLEAVEDLEDGVDGVAEGERALAVDAVAQGAAGDDLHGGEEAPVDLLGGVDVDEVRVAEGAGEAALAEEGGTVAGRGQAEREASIAVHRGVEGMDDPTTDLYTVGLRWSPDAFHRARAVNKLDLVWGSVSFSGLFWLFLNLMQWAQQPANPAPPMNGGP